MHTFVNILENQYFASILDDGFGLTIPFSRERALPTVEGTQQCSC